MMRHPQNSGLQMDQLTRLYIPPFFIDNLKIWQGDDLVVAMEGGIAISEDPNLRFNYKPNGAAKFPRRGRRYQQAYLQGRMADRQVDAVAAAHQTIRSEAADLGLGLGAPEILQRQPRGLGRPEFRSDRTGDLRHRENGLGCRHNDRRESARRSRRSSRSTSAEVPAFHRLPSCRRRHSRHAPRSDSR